MSKNKSFSRIFAQTQKAAFHIFKLVPCYFFTKEKKKILMTIESNPSVSLATRKLYQKRILMKMKKKLHRNFFLTPLQDFISFSLSFFFCDENGGLKTRRKNKSREEKKTPLWICCLCCKLFEFSLHKFGENFAKICYRCCEICMHSPTNT